MPCERHSCNPIVTVPILTLSGELCIWKQMGEVGAHTIPLPTPALQHEFRDVDPPRLTSSADEELHLLDSGTSLAFNLWLARMEGKAKQW